MYICVYWWNYSNTINIVLVDNAKIHDENLIEILEELGCHIVYPPPHSLDLNPIEIASGV